MLSSLDVRQELERLAPGWTWFIGMAGDGFEVTGENGTERTSFLLTASQRASFSATDLHEHFKRQRVAPFV